VETSEGSAEGTSATHAPELRLLGKEAVHRRLTQHYSVHSLLIVSIFKGVALYEAAVSLFAIFSTPYGFEVKLTAFAMWLAAFAAIIAGYNGIMLSSIIVVGITSTADLVGPFVMGLFEFTVFATLVPLAAGPDGAQPSDAAQLDHLTWWLFALGLLLIVAWFSLRNYARRSAREDPGDIAAFLKWQSDHLSRRSKAQAGNAVVMFVAFLVFHYGPSGLRHWQALLALYALAGLIVGIVFQERGLSMLAASVEPASEQAAEAGR
jgi:hypothetical protein